MDGFAVRSAETLLASPEHPVLLELAGSSAAGAPSEHALAEHGAIRIMTGAVVPEGADAVVPFEDRDLEASEDGIVLTRHVSPGENVRLAGEDLGRGAVAINAGSVMRPFEIGLCAALGIDSVRGHRRPRVGVLVTGNEVVRSSQPLGAGEIRDSNGPLIATMLGRWGAEVVALGTVADDVAEVKNRLAVNRSLDFMVTTGGVSVGDFD